MPTIPKTMKGVIVEKTGGIEVLEYKTDLPVPEPKEGEILVKNDFIGVNYIDTSVLFSLLPISAFSTSARPADVFIYSQLLPQRTLPVT
jgi:NADPH2:quinone reductase